MIVRGAIILVRKEHTRSTSGEEGTTCISALLYNHRTPSNCITSSNVEVDFELLAYCWSNGSS